MYRTAVKRLALFQKRTVPGTGQRIAATDPLAPGVTKRVLKSGLLKQRLVRAGSSQDKGMLDAGEIWRENIDRT
jgi:hypothetical protein